MPDGTVEIVTCRDRRPDPSRRASAGTDAAHRDGGGVGGSGASITIAWRAKRAPERSNRSHCPLASSSSRRPSVAITRWRT